MALPRLADWYELVASVQQEIGLPEGLLDKALQVIREDSLETITNSSLIAQELMRIVIRHGKVRGTATKWLEAVRQEAGPTTSRNPRFPQTAQEFSVELARLEPALRERGISVTRIRRAGGCRERVIILKLEQGE